VREDVKIVPSTWPWKSINPSYSPGRNVLLQFIPWFGRSPPRMTASQLAATRIVAIPPVNQGVRPA
jgi:hypothetical protein